VFIAIQVFVSRVQAGREFFAVGGNRQAARDAGIPVTRRIVTGFMISGFVAALAGIINTLERTTADPTAGSTVLLTAFAAAIIGGNYLKGGRGSIVGTLIGAAALGVLQVALTISGVQIPVQQIFIGAILLIAVTTDPNSLRSVRGSLRTLRQGRAKTSVTT
jgi:ribose transport system permease protein